MGCNAHPSCPPASRRPPPAAVPCALRGSPQAPNLLRLNRKKRDQFGPASHPSCMFEATGAVWKRRRKPVATEIRTCCAAASAAADTAVETARAKVSRQRWDRAASSTSSAPQASAIRTVLLHTGARAVACILAPGLSPCKRQRRQDAAEQRQRLDSGGHILRSSLKSELQETHLRLRRAHPAGRSSFSPNSLVPRIQIFPWLRIRWGKDFFCFF